MSQENKFMTPELLQELKAEALALSADGANMSMSVGSMFVLEMIARLEANDAIVAAAQSVVREALENEGVHPSDINYDSLCALVLFGPTANLYAALMQAGAGIPK